MGRSRPLRWARPVLHGVALLLALSAVALTAAALDVHPVVAVAALVAAAGLTGYLVRTSPRPLPPPAENAVAPAPIPSELDRLERENARLTAALTFKNDLTSMLTHDVAQPISSIASLSELLRADWADLPDDIRFELASKIDKNTHRLIKMMNDLQMLFRLDTAAVAARRAPVPVLEVVAPPGEGVQVVIDEDVSVLADREHLALVVQNLVRNAVEHGETPVVVGAARQGDTVVLTVQDSGPGIAEDRVPELFGRFTRGAGMGLFIVRHLVEANGGTVRYEQVRPRGARLVVTMEAAPV